MSTTTDTTNTTVDLSKTSDTITDSTTTPTSTPTTAATTTNKKLNSIKKLKKKNIPKKPQRKQYPINYKLWHTQWPIEVYKHPVNGRYLVAQQDVEEQTVILRDLPYTWAVDHASCDIVCQHCFLEVPLNQQVLPTDFYMCEGCNRVGYCSTTCKQIDFAQHRFECQIFKELDTEEYSPFLLSEIKLLVRTLSRKWLEDSIYLAAGIEESEIPKTNTYGQYKNNQSLIPQDNGLRYNDYADLVSNVENYNESLKESLSYWICKYIVKLSLKVGKEEDEEELLKILLRNRCNAFYIQGRPRDGSSGESRGCGVYVRNSFFNHSCDPNVNYWVVNNTLEVECTLLRNVKEGEELTISYIDTSAPLNKRREKLLEGYLFHCLCNKCKSDELLPLEQTGEVNSKDDETKDNSANNQDDDDEEEDGDEKNKKDNDRDIELKEDIGESDSDENICEEPEDDDEDDDQDQSDEELKDINEVDAS